MRKIKHKDLEYFCQCIDAEQSKKIAEYIENSTKEELNSLYKILIENYTAEKYFIVFNEVHIKGKIKLHMLKQLLTYKLEK